MKVEAKIKLAIQSRVNSDTCNKIQIDMNNMRKFETNSRKKNNKLFIIKCLSHFTDNFPFTPKKELMKNLLL